MFLQYPVLLDDVVFHHVDAGLPVEIGNDPLSPVFGRPSGSGVVDQRWAAMAVHVNRFSLGQGKRRQDDAASNSPWSSISSSVWSSVSQ